MNKHPVSIYTDGACSMNPGPGGWAFVAIYRVKERHFVTECGGHAPKTTNNQMEIKAMIEALKWVSKMELLKEGLSSVVKIYTDSTYGIKGATEWIASWKRRGWKTSEGNDVLNQELWQELDELLEPMRKSVQFIHVKGHSGIAGNERADKIAVGYSLDPYASMDEAQNEELKAYSRRTGINLNDEPPPIAALKPQKKITPVYLSIVSGELKTHHTWKECEARVKGRPQAKYKKVTTQEEYDLFLNTHSALLKK